MGTVLHTFYVNAFVGLYSLPFLMLSSQTNAAVVSRNCNGKNEYKVQRYGVEHCFPCTRCHPGSGMVSQCNATSDIICLKCSTGTFSHGGHKPCRPCRKCEGDSHIARACRPYRNTHCRTCKTGRYYDSKKKKCKKCHICPPGTYIKRKCSSLHNTECGVCPQGTYSNRFGMFPFCKPCRRCQHFEEIIQICNATHNNICGNCKSGFFRHESTLSCGKCSDCYPDHPGYTFQIPECVRTVNNTKYTCMPMLQPPSSRKRLNVMTSTLETIDLPVVEEEEATTQTYTNATSANNAISTNILILIPISAIILVIIFFIIILKLYKLLRHRYISTHRNIVVRSSSFKRYFEARQPFMIETDCQKARSDSDLYINKNDNMFDECNLMTSSKSVPLVIHGGKLEDFENFLNEHVTVPRSIQIQIKTHAHRSGRCDCDIKSNNNKSISTISISSSGTPEIYSGDRSAICYMGGPKGNKVKEHNKRFIAEHSVEKDRKVKCFVNEISEASDFETKRLGSSENTENADIFIMFSTVPKIKCPQKYHISPQYRQTGYCSQ